MRVTVEFNPHGGKEEIAWFRSITDFPKFLRWQGNVYEFVTYAPNGHYDSTDYTFHFSERKLYSQKYYEIPSFGDMFRGGTYDCQCGAKYDRHFPNIHMFLCPKWKPPGEKK